MFSQIDLERLAVRCRELPPAEEDHRINEYVPNLFLTVLDLRLDSKIVRRAYNYFQAHRSGDIQTHTQLASLLDQYPNDPQSNTTLAIYLWGYRYWNRVETLRGVVGFFGTRGITTQQRLREWAATSDFKRDFEGKISNLGFAAYKWLVMRLGVNTVKPDIHLHRFVSLHVGRRLGDRELVELLEGVAKLIGLSALELDWRI
jgi:hypothetical protein